MQITSYIAKLSFSCVQDHSAVFFANALIEQGNYELLVQNKRVTINVVYEQNKERMEQMTGLTLERDGGGMLR
jgi:hypothetical protein